MADKKVVKVVPDRILASSGLWGGQVGVVQGVTIHAPGEHRHWKGTTKEICFIRRDLYCVQVTTTFGSRFFGFERAWIGSDLRVHVSGYDAKFEEVQNWGDSDEK